MNLLEARVTEFQKQCKDKSIPATVLVDKAEVLVNDLWMSVQIYRAMEKENPR